MFYTHRVLFLHKPRTGGTALTQWAQLHLNASADLHHLIHAGYDRLTTLMPELAKLQAFTIDRDYAERRANFEKAAADAGADPSIVRIDDPDVPKQTIHFEYENPHRAVLEWLELMHHGKEPD